ncbi:MAG: hypothetical protein ACXVGB_00030 [Mycobacteriaceae bacterium]
MSAYPGGGTPPTTFVPVHAVSDHIVRHVSTLPFTGGDVTVLLVVGLLCLFAGMALRGVRPFGKSEHQR